MRAVAFRRARTTASETSVVVQIQEDGVASGAADIDTIWVNGYGFPQARGGPMRYAEDAGLANVLRWIRRFGEGDPAFWRISLVLEEAARRGRFK